MTFTKLMAVALIGGLGIGLTGACSSCVQEEDRLILRVAAADDLADTGAGAQHVQFRAWAVKDRKQFDAASDEALGSTEPKVLVDSDMGDVFESSASWITPGGSVRLQRNVKIDDEYTHVGLVVLFPEPKRLLLELDCDDRTGYELDRPEHQIEMWLGRDSVQMGGRGGGKKKDDAED